ncbi:hypothetical protein BJY00DRAFT_35562 [Aspergillus carlsbadensis]|nr:hypothetical protein BJY00DRAFT_35562 [Aspergillus carlsbadensis]
MGRAGGIETRHTFRSVPASQPGACPDGSCVGFGFDVRCTGRVGLRWFPGIADDSLRYRIAVDDAFLAAAVAARAVVAVVVVVKVLGGKRSTTGRLTDLPSGTCPWETTPQTTGYPYSACTIDG